MNDNSKLNTLLLKPTHRHKQSKIARENVRMVSSVDNAVPTEK